MILWDTYNNASLCIITCPANAGQVEEQSKQ